jgi:MFS family permease
MMLSDLAAGISSIIVLLLYSTGNLEIWHLYITGAFAGAFQAFQFPAYSAAIATMLPKEQFGRANGMLSLAEAAPGIFAPVFAGFLLGLIGIGGVLAVDIVTFIAAVSALAVVHIPQPAVTAEGQAGRGSIWKEAAYGFRYILERPSLLGLQLVFLGINLVATFGLTVSQPMILSRTNDNAQLLGTVLAANGIGGLAGGLIMSTWGGPKRRVHGVLGGMILSSLLGMCVLGVGRSLPVWMIGSFFSVFFIPILNGCNQAIWQAKVAPDVQGRVFAARRLIAQISAPVAMLVAGPLADYVFEPSMRDNGLLARLLGWLVGTGPGAGMALMIVGAGLAGVLIAALAYLSPAVRKAETILPDYVGVESQSDVVPSDEALQQVPSPG